MDIPKRLENKHYSLLRDRFKYLVLDKILNIDRGSFSHIVLKDENDQEVLKYLAYFPGGLKKGETKTITATAHGNFTNAKTKIIVE